MARQGPVRARRRGRHRAGPGRGGSPVLPPNGSGLPGRRPIESATPAWLAAPRLIRSACRTDGEARFQVGEADLSFAMEAKFCSSGAGDGFPVAMTRYSTATV